MKHPTRVAPLPRFESEAEGVVRCPYANRASCPKCSTEGARVVVMLLSQRRALGIRGAARLLGITPATLSRFVGRPRLLRSETRERIAVAALGAVPPFVERKAAA